MLRPADAAVEAEAELRADVRRGRCTSFRTAVALFGIATAIACAAAGHMFPHSTRNNGRGVPLPVAAPAAVLRLHSSTVNEGKRREGFGMLQHAASGRCLFPDGKRPGLVACAQHRAHPEQSWAFDRKGFIRSLLGGSECLTVKSSLGCQNETYLSLRACDYSGRKASNQLWEFHPGGFIVSKLTLQCLDVVASHEVKIQLGPCEFGIEGTSQAWVFINMGGFRKAAVAATRPPNISLREEDRPLSFVELPNLDMLTLDDVTRSLDPNALLDGSFWSSMPLLFEALTPDWNKWAGLFKLWKELGNSDPAQNALGTAYILNIMSNIVFAGMNFVQGFDGPDLNIWGDYKLDLHDFVGNATRRCRSRVQQAWGAKWLACCEWRRAVDGEAIGIVSFRAFLNEFYKARLPNNTFLDNIFIGRRIPSWEDNLGISHTFRLLDAGFSMARLLGHEPVQIARTAGDARFAFDAKGLALLFRSGFGWSDQHDFENAYNGGHSSMALDQLIEKYGDHKDVLGLLMTDSALSMHLEFNGSCLLVDLTEFERYTPIQGYASLGGRAFFQEGQGRLVTVRIEYGGRVFSDFDDAESDRDWTDQSTRSGWRFAQAAVIATLMAKTQLLVHIRAIHFELAPALQAVTVDAFVRSPEHPLRRLLEPFISRGVQAAQYNLKLWFQYRAGEFGLAPLTIEEQLRLLQEATHAAPLNLADLDMERYAKARGMERFTEGSTVGKSPKPGQWRWRWHSRALKVQRLLQELLECWLRLYYGGGNTHLAGDTALVGWWGSLLQHMPSLRVAAARSSDWLVRLKSRAAASTDAAAAAAATARHLQSEGYDDTGHWVVTGVHGEGPKSPEPQGTSTAVPPRGGTTAQAWQAGVTTLPSKMTRTVRNHTQGTTTTKARGLATTLARTTLTTTTHTTVHALAATLDRTPTTANPALLEGLPALNAKALRNVLRTVMVWMSWIHEDVGHSAASLVYSPIYTPTFVPEDGVGIPVVPLNLALTAYRNFVFVERAKLTDTAPPFWFDRKLCEKYMVVFNTCTKKKDDKLCFTDFQDKLKQLSLEPEFSDCDAGGVCSCMNRTEISASS